MNLDENPTEFRAWYPASSSDVLWEDPTVDLLRNSHSYHLPKIQLDLTVQTPENFRLVHHFLDLFSARERIRPEFIFFMNGILDIFFEGSFRMGCCALFSNTSQ